MPPAGLLARGSLPALGLPGAQRSSGRWKGCSPLTVAGAAAELGSSPHRVPFCVPHHAGTDDGGTIAALPRFARAPARERIDKAARPAVKCPGSTVSRMRGTGNAVRGLPQIRGCPRNCKRRASSHRATGKVPGRRRRLRPASQETYRRFWSLAGRGASERLVGWRPVRSRWVAASTPSRERTSSEERRQGDSHRHRRGRRSRHRGRRPRRRSMSASPAAARATPRTGVAPRALRLARATARAAEGTRRHRAAGALPRQLQSRPAAPPSGATAPGPMCSAGSSPSATPQR